MGIEQLVDTFKGTPQPLEAKVQRDNKGQPPGAVPKDLQEVIALQEIAKVRQGMQNQQAMQAGGAQPSVAEKLRQMVGAMRAQGQPQMAGVTPQQQMPGGMPQQTVMAAGGGSLDQLISNLGRHYAGGGIIAFTEGGRGEDKDPDAEDKKPLRYYPLSEQGADWVARKQAARAAEGENEARRQALISQIPTGGQEAPAASNEAPDTELTRNVNNAMAAMPGASAAKGFAGGLRGLMAMIGALGNRENKVAPEAPGPYMDSEVEKLKRLAANPAAAQNTNPALQPRPPAAEAPSAAVKPNTGGGNKPGINAVKPEAMDPLETALRASIMQAMGKDGDQEWQKGAKRYQEFMGLDKLLQPREARIAEREGMLRKIQGERLPDWVAGLDRASKPIVSGGIGTLLNQYGTGKQDQKKAYDAEDLKFFDQISDMKDEVVKLKMEGKYKAAAAGEAAIKDMLADKRQAEQSGTSLLNTKENVRSREQTALDNRLARQQSARQHSDNQALALEERKRQFNESELRRIREKDVDRANKIEAAISKRVGNIDLQLQMPKIKPEVEADLLRRRNEIVKQVQAEYPSVKPEKPSESQFMAVARAANPGVSDAELKAYYKQNYGT